MVTSSWIKKDSKVTKYVMNNIPEFLIYPNGKQELIIHNHFIIQTVRIPLKEKPSIRKIIQLALNIDNVKVEVLNLINY